MHEVYTDHVAVPEVRTGKVDLRAISTRIKRAPIRTVSSFDTVAVPEYHTGKCAEWDPDCEEKHEHKHHGMLADLTRTLFNGTPDK